MHAASMGPTHPRNAAFPRVAPHAPNTAQTPPREQLSLGGRVKRTLWNVGARAREPDMLYAVKTGACCGAVAVGGS